MTELNITTPAVLFPAISLLLLAYTNRYIAISNRIRVLYDAYHKDKSEVVLAQIKILKKRIHLIKNMQLFGVLSIFSAALTMFLIYQGLPVWSTRTFFVSILSLLGSLVLSIYEIMLSNKALFLLLREIEEDLDRAEVL